MHLPAVLHLLLCVTLSEAADWCYTGCDHTPTHWSDIPGTTCGGQRQSPVDIVSARVETSDKLRNFTFSNFSSGTVLKTLLNNGHTVKCLLQQEQVEVWGGGLNGSYSSPQFHLHWGDSQLHPGSEHTLDGHRFPMEMHIVSLKKGVMAEQAVKDPEGIAVLGFFINVTEEASPSPAWEHFTSYLMNLSTEGSSVNITHNISISDLLGSVDLTKFYRYLGSLTTPQCNEAVVWTVFQEPIMVHRDLIQRFPAKTSLSNVYRPTQQLHGRKVYGSPAVTPPSGHSWCYDDGCDYRPDHWHLLPGSFCGGVRQSPIDIMAKEVTVDPELKAFSFKHFDDKQAIDYITNTGHTVKCVLKKGVVEVSGGGLDHTYSTLQFHFHWGDTSETSRGSEHAVNSAQYTMEMHIVSQRKDLTLDQAKMAPDGLAVLAFFIEAEGGASKGPEIKSGSGSGSGSGSQYWTKLTSYLSAVSNTSSQATVHDGISIDDLLGQVDRTQYYRYNGSLTTPTCNEAVVWTVFKNPIKVDKELLKLFPANAGFHQVRRPLQAMHGRIVRATSAAWAPGPAVMLLLFVCLSVCLPVCLPPGLV